MLGDSEKELTLSCHAQLEAEANYAAGQILFMAGRFVEEAGSSAPTLSVVRELNGRCGSSITSTLWRYVEQVRPDLPMVGLATGHPHRSRRKAEFDPTEPFRDLFQRLRGTDPRRLATASPDRCRPLMGRCRADAVKRYADH